MVLEFEKPIAELEVKLQQMEKVAEEKEKEVVVEAMVVVDGISTFSKELRECSVKEAEEEKVAVERGREGLLALARNLPSSEAPSQ